MMHVRNNCNENQSIEEFLKDMKSPNDPDHTHVSMGIPKGIYSFGSKMSVFWKIYDKSLEANVPMYLAENPGKETPIVVDIDLRVKKSSLVKPVKKIYTDDHVSKVIMAYHRAIDEVVDFTGVDEEKKNGAYTCVLLEKEPYEAEICGELYIKNGFHLHFPKLFLDRKVHEVYIIPKVKEFVEGLFDDIGSNDFLDSKSIHAHWLLYGSRKQNGTPYVATKCFTRDAKRISFEEGLGDYVCNKYPGDTDASLNCKKRVKKMLPKILSIFLYDRVDYYFYNPKLSVTTPLVKLFQVVKQKRKQWDNDSITKTLAEANQFIGMMNSSRADDRYTWLRVGYCLWNICKGDDEGFNMWVEFSKQSEKFSEAECISLWNKARPNNFTIGTLKYYAKQDSPEEYNKLIEEKTHNLVIEAVNGCHTDVAKILYNEYGNEFVCTSISNKEWYQFKDHIWKPLDKGTALRERISADNGIIIKQLRRKLREVQDTLQILTEETDKNEKKDYEKRLKKIKDLIRQCKATPFKNHVMVEAQEVFYNPEFYNLLNKNPHIIAFKNGVYDFENKLFRDGNPEDYLSISLPIEYVDYGFLDHPDVMEVDDFFQKVFPDKEVRDYFLDQMSRIFIGGNHDKIIQFWTGEGNNGKTVTQTLFEKMMGKLAVKFSTSLITGKKTQMGSANPELARAGDGVRWGVMDEPNADEQINSGTLKGLTGNDSFWARDLFQKGKETREIQPMFKLCLICNKLPMIKDADTATWNRIRVIPFSSTFVPESECPTDLDEQVAKGLFPMDKNFNDKIPKMTQPLAWYLIQRWKTTDKCDHGEPEAVKVATTTYMNNNDIFKQFEQQCVINKNGTMTLAADLYMEFKEWAKDENLPGLVPSRTIVVDYFKKKWGPLEKGKYWRNKILLSFIERSKGIESSEESDHE